MNAGVDQFGGVDDGAPLAAAVKAGLVIEARLDQAVERIMKVKFDLGLFENPFADSAQATKLASSPAAQREGVVAQARALVVLENSRGATMLPRAGKLFVHGVDTTVAKARGYRIVGDPSQADIA